MSTMDMLAWKARPLQPHVRFMEGQVLAVSLPTEGITAECPCNFRG